MKKCYLIVSIFWFFSILIQATENNPVIIQAYYGVQISAITTGTGHGTGYTFSAHVTKGRKALEAGFIYSTRESRISGADIKHRVYLSNLEEMQNNKKHYLPYLQYNLVYQKGISYSPELITLGGNTYLVKSDPGIIATMGHYIGYGNNVRFYDRFYMDAFFGLGFYTGSLDKVFGPGTWGFHKENNGITYSIKFGIGYHFK